MKYILRCALSMFFLWSTHAIAASSSDSNLPVVRKADLQEGLDQIVNNHRYRGTVGIIVQSMSSGRVLYQKNPDMLFTPASSLKILTGYAALRHLGPDFHFETELRTDAQTPITQGVLMGDLTVKFAGDPTLMMSDLNGLLAGLKTQGIKKIEGHVWVDTHAFDSNSIAPGTVSKDSGYCYGAPITAGMINQNCVSIQVNPTRAGKIAKVSFPDGIALPVSNAVRTKASNTKKCYPILRHAPVGQPYPLSGCIREKSGPYVMSVPLTSGNGFSVTAVRDLLKQQGVIVTGGVLATPPPATSALPSEEGTRVLAVHRSAPLRDLVTDMMKHSDNIIASTLFKKLAQVYWKQQGAWERGGPAVKAILSQSDQVNLESVHMVDGSGLSRQDAITPRQLVSVLKEAYRDPQVSDVFIQALPIAGIDGTLKRRLRTRDVVGKVRAKTGTMQGVTALAGYVETRQGEPLVFSIVVNDFPGSTWPFRELEDNICRYLRL